MYQSLCNLSNLGKDISYGDSVFGSCELSILESTVDSLKDIRSGSNDERFVKSNRSRLDDIYSFVLPFSLSLSLFFSVFSLACGLISSCLAGESSREVELTRRGRVFQAGCRLPPP